MKSRHPSSVVRCRCGSEPVTAGPWPAVTGLPVLTIVSWLPRTGRRCRAGGPWRRAGHLGAACRQRLRRLALLGQGRTRVHGGRRWVVSALRGGREREGG